jgi:hypothetical protein
VTICQQHHGRLLNYRGLPARCTQLGRARRRHTGRRGRRRR